MAAALLKPGDLDQPIPPKEEPKVIHIQFINKDFLIQNVSLIKD